MFHLSNIVRSQGDPKVLRTGPSSLGNADRMARNLGWFSIGLGAVELLGAERLARALGMRGRETLIRAYGVREILSGVLSLSVDKKAGLWSRVAGDGLDAATLMGEFRSSNPMKHNLALALLMVGGVAVLDYMTAQQVGARHAEGDGRKALYHDRTGFPKGIESAKAAAKRLAAE
jgi:hypothetical protein